jgi:hypothetical protein
MSVLNLILNHDPQVQLLWEFRCECSARNPLIGAVYAHEEDHHLYIPSLKGRHAAAGVTVRRAPRELRLDPGVVLAEIVECSRCRSHFALTSAPVFSAFLAIRLGLPAENPFEDNEHLKVIEVPFDAAAIQVVPGLFLTSLGKATYSKVAPG